MAPRHSSRDVAFIKDVLTELKGARLQFPTNEHQLAALTEEVGELAQALIDSTRGTQTPQDVYAEAVQVAAMACRVAVDGDKSFGYLPPPLRDRDLDAQFATPPAIQTGETLTEYLRRTTPAHASGPQDVTPIKGWAAIIHEPATSREAGSFYMCPTIWLDRWEAVKEYGSEKIAAFIPVNTFVGDK